MTEIVAGGQPQSVEEVLSAYGEDKEHVLKNFMNNVVGTIGEHPRLTIGGRKVVHSYKSRMKDRDHLRAKIARKNGEGRSITSDNLFQEVTDLAGVRILHLFQEDFRYIHEVICGTVDEGDWFFAEPPKVYTWDPEAVAFFREFGLEATPKPSSYTSVHYLVRPREDSPLCCEIQVRTLFEEIWGEVDHQINYPVATKNAACREQLMVLSKIVGAGSRLLDSIQRAHKSEN